MSRYELTRTVVMVGMMGAGKTAVGTALARLLGVAIVDSDAEIELAANMRIAEIFEKYGEAFFRDRESRVLARLLDGEPSVLSTGGGAFLDPNNRQMIADKGLAVWLKADLDLLWARVRHKTTRPLLQVPEPKARLSSLLAEREPCYSRAGLVVEAEPNLSVQEMAEKVLAALLAYPGEIIRER
ncbi:MAG: shikimate kinase [Rhodobacteraceae bacterium]|nr:shikimate kinase [Paracoccaceae bacterium]